MFRFNLKTTLVVDAVTCIGLFLLGVFATDTIAEILGLPVGIVAVASGHTAVGAALVFAGIGSMAAAALVLLLSSPERARAAITQGTLPVLGIAALLIGLLR